jgi:TRAP-type C4-dicarboxylate transport system permease small subunit
MDMLERILHKINNLFLWIAGLFLIGMVGLTCFNIVCREIAVPIKGTYELMGYFGAIVVSFALGQTQLKRGHIAVDVIFQTFPKTVQKLFQVINNCLCMAFFSLAAWQLWRWGLKLKNTGEVTETLRIAYYPFCFGVAVGCVLLTLVFGFECVRIVGKGKESDK